MDLHLLDAEPTEEEREALDAFLWPPASGWDGGERDPERGAQTPFGGPAAPVPAGRRLSKERVERLALLVRRLGVEQMEIH